MCTIVHIQFISFRSIILYICVMFSITSYTDEILIMKEIYWNMLCSILSLSLFCWYIFVLDILISSTDKKREDFIDFLKHTLQNLWKHLINVYSNFIASRQWTIGCMGIVTQLPLTLYGSKSSTNRPTPALCKELSKIKTANSLMILRK